MTYVETAKLLSLIDKGKLLDPKSSQETKNILE
jgi:hypothetical protein